MPASDHQDPAAAWSVAVFAHNEARHIAATLQSIAMASAGVAVDVVVLANGCSDRTVQIVRERAAAWTHLRVLESFGGRAALVECRLETGRTHQIRVHLSERAGAPLLGDALYGRIPAATDLAAVAAALGRQALHAAALGFAHPATGKALRFEVEPPEDFRSALEALRALKV